VFKPAGLALQLECLLKLAVQLFCLLYLTTRAKVLLRALMTVARKINQKNWELETELLIKDMMKVLRFLVESFLFLCETQISRSNKINIPQWGGVVSITAAHLELKGIKHDPGAHRNQSTTEARRRRRRRTPC
jgi:hypothetical protein